MSIKDVADLADVPETQLQRVVRIMAMAGFMSEPTPGFVKHTLISAGFLNRPALLDAGMFLGETAAPFALRMAATTRCRHEDSPSDRQSDDSSGASSSASSGPISWRLPGNSDKQSFQSAYQQRPKLQRQWPAYFRCLGDAASCGTVALLSQLNWASLGNACIVDVGGQSLGAVTTLAKLYPQLHFVVQTEDATTPAAASNHMATAAISSDAELSGRITARKRASGTPQTLQTAAVYLVRLSHHNPLVPLRSRVSIELRAHLGVLEANRSALLILMVQVLPEPGALDEHTEGMARVRDMALLQLVDGGDLVEEEVMAMVDGVRDENGRLAVVKKLCCRDSAEVAIGIKYQNDENRKQQLAFMPETI